MKKRLSVLTMLMATALIASGCSSDSVELKKDGNDYVVYSINVDGSVKNFNTLDLLKEFESTSTAKQKIYNEVARQVFIIAANKKLNADDKANGLTEGTSINEIITDAAEDVEEFKQTTKDAAKEQSVDYDKYLEAQLESKGVTTLDEVKELYIYEAKKKALLNDYVEDNYEYYLEQYLNLYQPMQVRHVLVAANTSDTKYGDGTMTVEKARKLVTILKRFVSGTDTFAEVASLTDDTSSKDIGGVMNFEQGPNFVSEFRFAPYILSVYSETTDAARLAKAKAFHLVDEDATDLSSLAVNEIYKNGIKTVKLADILALEEKVAATDNGYLATDPDVTKIEQVYEMNLTKYLQDGSLNPKYYEEYELARNQIFNKTLNCHQVQFIEVAASDNAAHTATVNGKTVLADENNQPIYVVYASTGIHFMSTVYDFNAKNATNLDDAKNYFRLYNKDEADKTVYKNTYIGRNGAYETAIYDSTSSQNKVKTNSDALLSVISNYVSNLEYQIFYKLVYGDKTIKVTYYNAELASTIEKFVTDKVTATAESFNTEVASSVNTYGQKLLREEEVKKGLGIW